MHEILRIGNSVLRQTATEVTEFTPELKNTLKEMKNIMEDANGVGLAAPQIGISKRFFVVDLDGIFLVFINPEILEKSTELVTFEEGCLSVPDIYENVKRPNWIKVRYLDADFKPHELVLDDVLARIFQHEYDHLEGILFVDKISSLKKNLLKNKLKKMQKNH